MLHVCLLRPVIESSRISVDLYNRVMPNFFRLTKKFRCTYVLSVDKELWRLVDLVNKDMRLRLARRSRSCF